MNVPRAWQGTGCSQDQVWGFPRNPWGGWRLGELKCDNTPSLSPFSFTRDLY